MAQWSDQDDPIGAVSAESLGISLHTGARRRLRSDSSRKFLGPPGSAITKRTARGRTAKSTKWARCPTPSGDVPELEDDSTDTASTDHMNLSPERGASDSAQSAADISSSRNAFVAGRFRRFCITLTLGLAWGISLSVYCTSVFCTT